MRIKKLELTGFKSFKDRTVIHFDSGVTGVVGPNGCGKSNIVDALIWVMGEMSARHLRGSSMEDVIFSGTHTYAPMGMCEVSLVLENQGGSFPAQYMNHSELMITRRLHRSGESEYLVNKQPARLRDIQEIFMDTGAGSKGFSIIEQGAIGRLVTSKPEERRFLIEEVAGITRFKARKKESQRKLKTTDENLARLRDITGELKRQMESLQRQARKAERYRELRGELEDMELWISSKEFLELRDQTKKSQTEFDQAEDRHLELEAKGARLEAQRVELRSGIVEEEKHLENFHESFKKSQDQLHLLENQIRETNFKIEQARNSKEIRGSLFRENQIREKTLSKELNILGDRLARIKEEAEGLKAQYESEKDLHEQKKIRIGEIEKECTDKKEKRLLFKEDEIQARSGQIRLEETASHLKGEIARAKTDLDQLQNEKMKLDKNYKKAFGDFEKERQLKMDIFNDVEALEKQKEQWNLEQNQRGLELVKFKDKLNEVTSRLYGLENLRDNFEGFQEGAKSIMLWQKQSLEGLDEKEQKSCQNFKPISEILRVPEEFEVALEAVLGSRLQTLVSRDREKTLKAVEYLKEKKSGRSTFYSQGTVLESHDHSESSLVKGCLGVKALVNEIIELPREYSPLVGALVDQVAVVEDIRYALELQLQFPAWSFVTVEGDLLTNEGLLSGGYKEDASSGVLKRAREIKELREAKKEWSGKIALALTTIKKVESQLKQVTENLDQARKSQTEKEISMTSLKKDLQRAQMEQNHICEALESQERNLDELLERQIQIQKELSELDSRITNMAYEKQTLESEIKNSTDKLKTEKSSLNDLQNKVTEHRVESARKQQEWVGIQSEYQKMEKSLTEVREQIGKMDEESSRNDQFVIETQVLLEEEKLKLGTLLGKVKEQESLFAGMKNELEKSNFRLSEIQEELSKTMNEKNKQQSVMHESQLLLEQAKMKEQNLVDQMIERYQKDLSRVAWEYARREGDREAFEQRVKTLKERLGRIGEVNLSAIEEYDQLAKRFHFLEKQCGDLMEAKSQLLKVIARINRICSKRFNEAFQAVNDRFQRVFPMLFGGGEARLILIEDPEKEESGVDIVAKPPGKKMQNVSLLSGGEKALTAVSLIFSVFLIKPSPYCLLDEVDAPLDDANVMRFNKLIKEMAKRSQVIVVTHNKYTMEIIEKLYGVTMEEKGVSKMVSVNLEAGP